MKRGSVYASIGAVLGLLLILVSFAFIMVNKEGITGAVVFEEAGGPDETENYVPPGIVRIVTNEKVLYVAKESLADNPEFCGYGNNNEECRCPAGFDRRIIENYYMCVKIF